MKALNKYLILSFFIFSIPSIGFALPKCGNTLHNCTGTYTWENGDKYVGDWKNNKMHGLGTYYYKESDNKYVGDWKNNKMHGFGTFYWNEGDKYVGDYLNDKRHGKGKYTYKSGNKYDGDWVNGKRTGEGVYTFANGKKQEGVFKDSKFLYAKKLKTNTIEKGLKAKGKELVNKANKVKSKNNSKTTEFIIANKEEYNKRPSVSFSNLSPDVRFLLESGAIGINWVKPSAIEIASRCILKARRDYPKSMQDSSGEINKIYIDFNRINWNTQDVIYGDGIYAKTRIKYSCRKNCHYDFGRTLFDYKVKWRAMKSISFYIRDSDNMFSRVTNALRDISKVCNKSTSKY